MSNSALILGVTGIVVSGIVGPAIAARLSLRAQVDGFNRSLESARRDELRAVLDTAATLLAAGATNLRILGNPSSNAEQLRNSRDWMTQVYPIGQRMQLWLPHEDPIVLAYDKVREQLILCGESTNDEEMNTRLQDFEIDRQGFLDLARVGLLRPVLPKGSQT